MGTSTHRKNHKDKVKQRNMRIAKKRKDMKKKQDEFIEALKEKLKLNINKEEE